MREFGPLRALWEGDYKGEKILQEIKPYVNSLHGNWAYNAHLKFMQRKSLARLLQMCDEPDLGCEDDFSETECAQKDSFNSDGRFRDWPVEDDDTDDVDIVSAYNDHDPDTFEGNVSDAISDEIDLRLFRTYKTEQTVISLFSLGKPMSMTYLQDERFTIQLKHNQHVPIKRFEHVIQACGLSYFRWELGAAEAVDPVNHIVSYCLMLPMLTAHGMPNTSAPGSMNYAVITSEWEELNSDGKLSHPNSVCFSL
jgi:hypothetical protein